MTFTSYHDILLQTRGNQGERLRPEPMNGSTRWMRSARSPAETQGLSGQRAY